jgi:hypothetical protein
LICCDLKGYPVTGFNDTLLCIYSKLGSFSAKDRADAISSKKKIADKLEFNTDSITIAEAETTFDLVNGESIIMSISENDAWNNSTKQELAKKYKYLLIPLLSNIKTKLALLH